MIRRAGSRSTFAAVVGLSLAIAAASAWLCRSTAKASGPAGAQMVYLRGPGDPDCAGELERARARGQAARLFATEASCRIYPAWKCPATCKGDELLVTHVTAKVQRKGELTDGQIVRKSESPQFDEMSLNAVRAGAPFPAPPASLLDPSGATALKIELVCDCAERPRPAKP